MALALDLGLAPHPARELVRNPDGSPALDMAGNRQYVCPIKDVQSVTLGGAVVAYCGVEPGRPITFITAQPDEVKEAVRAYVAAQVGDVSRVSAPPRLDLIEDIYGEIFDDGADDGAEDDG